MRRFCYKCGSLEADAGPLIQGLCQRCFSEAPLLKAPREVDVAICKGCGSYKIGNRWSTPASGPEVEIAIRETILDKIRVVIPTDSGPKLVRPTETSYVKVDVTPLVNENLAKVRAMGKVHSLQAQPKLDEVMVKLNLNYGTCEVCSLKRAKHHEAILQLRGELSRDSLSRLKKAVNSVAANASARDPMDFIADVKEQHGGLDIYVSSLSLAKKMAAMLKSKFRASLSESAKLVGQTRDGRKKYRVSILAKFEKVTFKRGE